MVDTVRTRAQVLALLADNITGDISPQDHRDAIVSLFGVYGAVSVFDGAAGQVPGVTPVKLLAFDTDGLAVNVVPDHANDRLTIGADGDGVYLVFFQCAFTGTNNASFEFEYYLNQVATGFKTSRKLGAASDVGSCALIGVGSLAAGDEIEIFVDGTGGATITVEDAQLIAVRIG